MSKRSVIIYVAVVAAALAFGVIIGSFFSMPNMSSGKEADRLAAYPLEIFAAGMHSHKQKEVPSGITPPSIRMEVIADPMEKRNYSLHIITENFRFAPESVSMNSVFGEGHAHLYIDDVFISRIYSPWLHIPALKPGRHVIYVTLNFSNHDEYAVNGNTIGVRTKIDVP